MLGRIDLFLFVLGGIYMVHENLFVGRVSFLFFFSGTFFFLGALLVSDYLDDTFDLKSTHMTRH